MLCHLHAVLGSWHLLCAATKHNMCNNCNRLLQTASKHTYSRAYCAPVMYRAATPVQDCAPCWAMLLPPACRQGHLTLQNVLLPGCTHQAVVLTGPSASLTARNVMFSGHGSSSSSNHSSSGSQDSDSNSSRLQGIVISAQQATITLDRVVITGNKGRLPRGEPSYHPPCNGSSILAPASTNGLVCGSPVLASSLIHLQDSTLTARDTTIAGNTASAVISTSGSAQHSLQLLSGTRLQDNTAAWLIVADSFGSDPVGRENLLAPHPSQKTAKQKLRFRPVYTTYDFMWHLKSMDDWRKVLAQQVAQPKVLQYVGRAPAGQVS